MTALVLYAAEKYIGGSNKAKVMEAVTSSLCEGLHLEAKDVVVVIEAFADTDSNDRVTHCFFPVLYTPQGTPYEYRKRAGELINERLRAIVPEEEIGHVYFHMKEHDYENTAVNGTLLKFDDDAIERIDAQRGEDSRPWLKYLH